MKKKILIIVGAIFSFFVIALIGLVIVYNSSLKDVAKLVNSSTMVNKSHGFLEDALIHRVLANVKQELLENGDLKEEC
jgi:hypothetical protein